jgi:hypothetical protein
MAIEVKLSQHPTITAVVRAAFPDYKKRAVLVVKRDTCRLRETYLDGTPHYTYIAVDLDTKQSKGAPEHPPAAPGCNTTVAIPLGVAIVQGGKHCGKPAQASVYVHPTDFNSLFPLIGTDNAQ